MVYQGHMAGSPADVKLTSSRKQQLISEGLTLMPSGTTFWESGSLTDYGYFAKGDNKSPDYHPEMLLVFVHGFQGHYKETWGLLPAWVQDQASVQCDVLSYWFASGIFQKGDYVAAARDLRILLTTPPYNRYRHLVFAVHSTGGLIVKKMLLDDKARLEGPGIIPDSLDPTLLTLRSRRIINIAVPHAGAKALLIVLFTLMSPFWFLCWWMLELMQLILAALDRSPRFPLGVNNILIQLVWGKKGLRKLEQEYHSYVTTLTKQLLPHPTSIDYIGAEDKAIATTYDRNRQLTPYSGDGDLRSSSQRGLYYITSIRGTHGSFKIPGTPNDIFVNQAGAVVKELKSVRVSTLADRSISIVLNVDRTDRVEKLIQEAENEAPPRTSKDSRRTVRNSWLGSQETVFDFLREQIEERNTGLAVWLLTGQAGVGKSTVLRRLCRWFASRSLSLSGNDVTVPLLIPMVRFEMQATKKGQQVDLRSLLSWWCSWANAILADEASRDRGMVSQLFTVDWVYSLLATTRVLLILDGIDDYIAKNQPVSMQAVADLLSGIRRDGSYFDTCIILGARSSLDLDNLTVSDHILEIASLSPAQAECQMRSYFTRTNPHTHVPPEFIHSLAQNQLLHTPLVLPKVYRYLTDRQVVTLHNGILESRVDLYEAALKVVLREGLLKYVAELRRATSSHATLAQNEDPWIDALMVLGHAFFTYRWKSPYPSQIMVGGERDSYALAEESWSAKPRE
jgi:hypothetical protein